MSYQLELSSNLHYIGKNKCLEKKILINNPSAIGKIEELNFDNHLSLIKNDIYFKDDYNIKFDTLSKNIIFTFLLEGSSLLNCSLNNKEISSKKDFTTIVTSNQSKGIKNYTQNTYLKSIQIILSEEYFISMFSKEFVDHKILKEFSKNSEFLQCLKLSKTKLKSKINIFEIFNTSFSGSFNKLYLQSKIFDLLYTETKELLSLDMKKILNFKFSQYDIEALNRAKNILIVNMKNPPSLSILSKMVHLNEFKLKFGFKKLFQNSPYGLLFEYKMLEAKKLLEKSEYDINEISRIVGYKYSCNFSTAFNKKFGILPKDLMKTRKYYY